MPPQLERQLPVPPPLDELLLVPPPSPPRPAPPRQFCSRQVRELAQLVSARHAVISEVHCCATHRPQSRMPESTPGIEMTTPEELLLLDAVPDEELDVAPELVPPLDAVPELAPDEDAVPEDAPDDVPDDAPDEDAPSTIVPPSGRTSSSV
jgi:hypothetical protein